MTKIVPAILEASKEQYLARLATVRQLTDRFQLDIIDGEFVENRTVQLADVVRQTDLKMDIHLMVAHPKVFVEEAMRLNPNTIIIQYECGEDLVPCIEKISKAGLRGGVSINPETKLTKLKPFVGMLDYVQLMAYPAGFSGQKFQPQVLDSLPELRRLFPTAEIGLDGGMSEKTAKKILLAGFDIANVNTYLFGADDPLNRYSQLLEHVL
jgi:ribulose-phosphate 3-epimerase